MPILSVRIFLGHEYLQLPHQHQLDFESILKNQAPVLHRLGMSKLRAYFKIFLIISICRLNKQLSLSTKISEANRSIIFCFNLHGSLCL